MFCVVSSLNKICIRDDTKAADRQTLNCIKKQKKAKYDEKRFSVWRMEFLHPVMGFVYSADADADFVYSADSV